MTLTATPPTEEPEVFDPDEFRMSIGDHLEELRLRLVYALLGFGGVAIVCLCLGQRTLALFCKPLVETLQHNNITPQVFFTNMSDPFMVWVEISMITAGAISAPWIVWQLWQFVAAGLYPNERKTVTKYVPLSLTLLVGGLLCVYFIVLPATLEFFLRFSSSIPLPQTSTVMVDAPTTQQTFIEKLNGDPKAAKDGQIWLNTVENRLKLFLNGETRVISFGPQNLTTPIITLPDYIDLVMEMLITFGLSFQLPLVLMALVSVGIVQRKDLKRVRRYVYFGMTILASIITPAVTAALMLMVPLIGLYELGIFLSRNLERSRDESDTIIDS